MPTLAPGNPEPQRGFTLLELLVVVSIIALATAGVGLSLRDTNATQLEKEGQRLVALLEGARAQSRTLGVAVFWQPGPRGFELGGQFRPWLAAGTQVLGPAQGGNQPLRVALGPEPLIPPQQLALRLQDRTVWLSTDGLRPFAISNQAPNTAAPTSATP